MDKYNFVKVSVRPATKVAIDVAAAVAQRPVYDLVGQIVSEALCEHPEESRVVLDAIYPRDGGSLTPGCATMTVRGFHCLACGRTIIPDPKGR